MITAFQTNAFQNNSWQIDTSGVAPVVAVASPGGGTIDWLKKKRKKGKVLRYSDFEGQEAYQAALATAIAEAGLPISKIEEPGAYEDEFGDDDEVIKALLLITTIH